MPTITVGNRQIKMPSPIYILSETIKISEEDGAISGRCLFPSSDPTVGERGDHANICHELFALWNCAHIMASVKGWRRLLAIRTSQKVRGMTPPDTEIDFRAEFTKVRRHGGRVVGSAKAEFSLNGKPLLLVNIDRFIEE